MKTAVIYARYSSESQTEQSIEGQLRVCNDYAKRNDIVIVGTYIDRAMTGTNDNRLEFQRMLKEGHKGAWDYIIVYKLDRFARNKYDAVVNKKKLRDKGIKLLSAMENLNDSPEGRLMEGVLEDFNQYFSEELAQKVKRGLRESWLKGYATGGNPLFGYDIVDRRYVINPYEAEIIKEAFTKYAQGYKVPFIAKEFKEKGYKRKDGKDLNDKHIYFILHNMKYTGRVEHNGEMYDNIFPRIIDDILWEAVSAIYNSNKFIPSPKKEKYDFILTGKLICGDCKNYMRGDSGTSRTKDIHYSYICSHKRRKKVKCNSKRIKKQEIEDIVINSTYETFGTEDKLSIVAENIYKVHKERTDNNVTLKSLEKKQVEIKKACDNMMKAIEMGVITEMTATRMRELEAQLLECNAFIEREKHNTDASITVEDIKNFLRFDMFENRDEMKVRRMIVNTFIREIIVFKDKIIITYNFKMNSDTGRHTPETVEKLLEEIESAFIPENSSSILSSSEPKRKDTNYRVFSFCFPLLWRKSARLCRFWRPE